jgi:hypothetical protein
MHVPDAGRGSGVDCHGPGVAHRTARADAVRLAAEATVTVDGLANRQYLGRVIEVPPAAQNGSFEVEVAIDNPELALRFGMPAHVVFAGPTRTVVLVPKTAITFGPAPSVVWIVAGDHLEKRQVRIGVDSGTSVEIVVGVAAGEHLAVSPVDDPAR